MNFIDPQHAPTPPGPWSDPEWAALLPSGVVVSRLDERGAVPPVEPEEAPVLARAVSKRKAQFARGRACARAALGQLGHPAVAIPRDREGLPVWPQGVVGSITHCEGLIAAAVARADSFSSLGIDAEPSRALGPAVARRVATPEADVDPPAGVGIPRELMPRLVFSAKEVVHKCVHPLTGVTLGFDDVKIRFDFVAERRGVFAVEPLTRRGEAVAELPRIRGRFRVEDAHLLTAGAIAREPLGATS